MLETRRCLCLHLLPIFFSSRAHPILLSHPATGARMVTHCSAVLETPGLATPLNSRQTHSTFSLTFSLGLRHQGMIALLRLFCSILSKLAPLDKMGKLWFRKSTHRQFVCIGVGNGNSKHFNSRVTFHHVIFIIYTKFFVHFVGFEIFVFRSINLFSNLYVIAKLF